MPGEAAWWRQTAQAVIETDTPQQLASAQLGGHTVLSAAMLHDDDFEADIGWGSMALLWLAADPDDPDEITRWWNARALRPRRWHKGMSVLATPDAVADGRFATDLKSFCLHGVFTRPHLVLASDSVPETQLPPPAQAVSPRDHVGLGLD